MRNLLYILLQNIQDAAVMLTSRRQQEFYCAYNIAQGKRATADSELLKKYLLDVVEIVCPENTGVRNIRLSKKTTSRRKEDINIISWGSYRVVVCLSG